MSSKRAIRRKSCSGKIRHADLAAAQRAIYRLNRDKGYQGPMSAYKCSHCGGWHIGHTPGKNPAVLGLRRRP